TKWLPFTHSTRRKGPHPTTASGFPALRSSGEYFCVALGEARTSPIRYAASMCNMNAYGCLSLICTVWGSITSTECTASRNDRMLDRVAGSNAARPAVGDTLRRGTNGSANLDPLSHEDHHEILADLHGSGVHPSRRRHQILLSRVGHDDV